VPFRANAQDAGLPGRVKLLSWGENLGRTTGAKIVVDDKAATLVPRYHHALALDKVLLDYEHQSHPGHPNFLPDPRPVPGHGEIEIVPGEGVFLSGLQYTPSGQEHAANYADVSAVVHLDNEHRLLYVSSVALTQCGDVAGMAFADHVAALSARFTLSAQTTSPIQKHTPMDQPDYRQLLIDSLGLKPDQSGEVSNESILAAIDKSKTAEAAEVAAGTAALGAKPTVPSNVTDIAALNARFDDRDRQDIIREAGVAGKVIPLSNETIKTLAPAALRELVDKLPAGTVALSTDATKTGKELPAARAVALSAEQAVAAKALGLTDEQYLKYNS
jgi:phage I-like protein